MFGLSPKEDNIRLGWSGVGHGKVDGSGQCRAEQQCTLV
jgi:hypothetical protein